MIVVEKTIIDNRIPTLHIVKDENKDKPSPFVIFIHGFNSLKEKNLHYAYLLAEKGFRVALPESIYHGERSKDMKEDELKMHFWNIVIHTIDEIEQVKDYFLSKKIIDETRIGLAGTSMGAIITFGALKKYSWIKVATSLMGYPCYKDLALHQLKYIETNIGISITKQQVERELSKLDDYDLGQSNEKLAGRPLLFWHGQLDDVVPHEGAYDFYQNVKPMYVNYPHRLSFISDPDEGHSVSNQGIMETVAWFVQHL
ncbi:prolyl oligopeptidase family serine peptidase [Bacillus carboniphilus]|uniref:Prolyl oligopeptidase family serine peptidase n=1 Tax=Bacillus carboniphilus TaxID=86663 RepID=A0ABY9JU79_9BACI|nr:prolyl oligopeptidase family serine peptidase [Bacillus carboniphilus]WLR42927.1 prolyl oligopeptidase family serine peptidase [Bacillus carboniphilus]